MRNFQLPGRSTVHAEQGMVATSHPLASTIGIEILKKGGNAVDAAVAMALILPLCEPQSTGLFGDVFALVKPANEDKIIGLNGSGRAPRNLTSDSLRKKGNLYVPECDVASITLPGAIKAFESLSNNYGKLGLEEICAPAIYYAENGVVVSPRVAFDWELSANNLKGVAREFYLDRGKSLRPGQKFSSSGQAMVLREFSKKGSKGFYEGEVAADLIDSLQNLGGVHTSEDFKDLRVNFVEPITAPFENFDLIEMPPNGQGVTAILMRKLMEKFEISKFDPAGVDRIHLEAEIAKLAYDARNRMIADPDFHEFNFEAFYSDEVVNNYSNKINLDTAMQMKIDQKGFSHKDTVYLTVIDRDCSMVSLIFSIFNSFGSGFSSEKLGLLFHNRGAGFSLEEGHPNELIGGKRPFHTIIPAFMRKYDEFIMPFGVMGGQYQANGHARLISNIIDFGMDVQTAIDFPRSFPENGFLKLESGYSDAIAGELESRGHKVVRPDQPIGGAQAIICDHHTGTLIGGSDPRKDGCALGY